MAEYYRKGTEAGFANPQSVADGGYQGKYIEVGGVKSIDLTRLDYLSLGQNGLVRDIMIDCINSFDIGCPSSQMAMKTGSTVKLEKTLSAMHGMNDSLIFLNGYSANLNVIQALGMRMRTSHLAPYIRMAGLRKSGSGVPTEFIIDGESHYSLIEGMKNARFAAKNNCRMHKYPTEDYGRLVEILKRSVKEHGDHVIRIIVSDTVSSMSGRVYDVQILCEIAEEFGCMLYLDEAHAIGSMGKEGCGISSTVRNYEKYKDRLLVMGTLTKAVSQLGGYVSVPSEELGCFLRCASPHYIFSAPLPPWMAEAVVRILEMIRGEYGEKERKKLVAVSAYMRDKLSQNDFNIMGSNSQIIPIFGGEEEVSFRTRMYLQEKGFTTAVFENPAVPKGKSIVRFSLCSDITFDEVDEMVEHLLTARKMFGI